MTSPVTNDQGVRRHMQAFDYVIIAASAVVLLSTVIPWYETSAVIKGVRETITRNLLSGNAGLQRPLVPIVAGLAVIEVVLSMASRQARQRSWKPHRGVVMLLCTAQAVLVVSCMLSSPLGVNSLANIGISINTGPGGWIAFGGAIVGMLAAFGRLFTGNSALGRSSPTPARVGAGSGRG